MKKSTIIIACVLTSMLGTYLSFAKAKPAEEMGRDIAQAYLDSSLIDENWSSSHPFIAAEVSYLTDKDTPSYKEYKVSCDKNPNCGWIIVNIDGDDVAIPAASTEGSANFELLNAKLDDALDKSGRSSEKARQLYYFSPFDQAIEDQDLNVATLRDGSDEQPSHDTLKKKIDDVKAIKQSDAFKKKKAEFDDKGLTSFARRNPLAMLGAYASATTIPDTFVPGASTSMCGSRIPCYKYNATYTYSGGSCQFGCVATALAMIYGYHDRQATYPNLIT